MSSDSRTSSPLETVNVDPLSAPIVSSVSTEEKLSADRDSDPGAVSKTVSVSLEEEDDDDQDMFKSATVRKRGSK